MGIKNKQKNIFILKNKIQNTSSVSTLRFVSFLNKPLDFIAGQYITLYFLNDVFGWQGKCYSISSPPRKKYLEISVKRIGNFSNAICNLNIGDKVKIIGPTGGFCINDKMKDIILIAGGVGITPFYSIIQALIKEKSKIRDVYLFYSNKKKEGILFPSELEKLSLGNPNLKIIHTLTQEKKRYRQIKEYERINIKMIKKYIGTLKDYHYFVCGSIGFVRDIWKMLEKNKIESERLLTEVFY